MPVSLSPSPKMTRDIFAAPITRCAAPDVDPTTAQRDIEVTTRLHQFYGHLLSGIYVQVTDGGRVAEGDETDLL